MWHDKGAEIPIGKCTYWLDNQIIKAFDCSGELCYLYKLKVSEDLSISITEHKDFKKHKNKKFESWQETTRRFSEHLSEIEKESINVVKNNVSDNRRIILLNSTGKDSMVTQHILNKSDVTYETYFNVTTLDVAESSQMAKQLDFKKILPDKKYGGFYQWINKENIIPSRTNRCCCKYFKEDPTINAFDKNESITFLLGMRNEESNTRAEYTDVWKNDKWTNRDWIGILPIRKWTELDVWLYTFRESIQINKKYTYGYDRVGCGIACPNYTKSTWVLDQYYYKSMYDRWQQILKEDFIKNNKWLIMNCTIEEYCKGAWTGGVFRTEPTSDVINEYAEHNNLDIEVASKYFNKYCSNGCLNKRWQPLKIKDKETLSMNMKLYGRNIDKFICKKCLLKELKIDKEEWDRMVADYKMQGCKLF